MTQPCSVLRQEAVAGAAAILTSPQIMQVLYDLGVASRDYELLRSLTILRSYSLEREKCQLVKIEYLYSMILLDIPFSKQNSHFVT